MNTIISVINNFNQVRPRLYRSLNVQSEFDAYQRVINMPENSYILYTSRLYHCYYFCKFNNSIFQVVTNEDLSDVYIVRNMSQEFEMLEFLRQE
jgi:hypothetical protein